MNGNILVLIATIINIICLGLLIRTLGKTIKVFREWRKVRDDELSTVHNGHEIVKCSCGAIIEQCKCSAPKRTRIVDKGCWACKVKGSEYWKDGG
jgi:hypothetical protein